MDIYDFNSFCSALSDCGFSMGGGNARGVFALIPFSWENQGAWDTPVKWHTGDPETDPWEWRMRTLEERDDIAYAKLFFRSSGYITADWYPYFLSCRRDGVGAEEAYYNGTLSREAKLIYDLISENGAMPVHIIKSMGGFGKADKSRFDRALTELQMRMFVTMCGRQQKTSLSGEEYGWSSTVFCTVEDFWAQREKPFATAQTDAIEAYEKIKSQILLLNPNAKLRDIDKFIKGK